MKTLFEKWVQPIRCFQNVSEYKEVEGPDYCWDITYECESYPTECESAIYFILDSSNHAAFSHWVYESSTWIPFFVEIQKRFPSCRLVLKQMKTYKHLFLDFYGVSSESILVEPNIEPKNFCFFHTYTSLNDTSLPSIYYINFIEYQKKLQFVPRVEKTIPFLYLPRGTKENFVGPNNRAYGIQTELKEIILKIGGTVYETDTTTDLIHQINMIRKAKVIILDYGSNLWVNGLFAQNSKLICLNLGWHQHSQYPSLAILWQKIQETNTIQQIFAHPSDDIQKNEVPIVQIHLPLVLQAIHESL